MKASQMHNTCLSIWLCYFLQMSITSCNFKEQPVLQQKILISCQRQEMPNCPSVCFFLCAFKCKGNAFLNPQFLWLCSLRVQICLWFIWCCSNILFCVLLSTSQRKNTSNFNVLHQNSVLHKSLKLCHRRRVFCTYFLLLCVRSSANCSSSSVTYRCVCRSPSHIICISRNNTKWTCRSTSPCVSPQKYCTLVHSRGYHRSLGRGSPVCIPCQWSPAPRYLDRAGSSWVMVPRKLIRHLLLWLCAELSLACGVSSWSAAPLPPNPRSVFWGRHPPHGSWASSASRTSLRMIQILRDNGISASSHPSQSGNKDTENRKNKIKLAWVYFEGANGQTPLVALQHEDA